MFIKTGFIVNAAKVEQLNGFRISLSIYYLHSYFSSLLYVKFNKILIKVSFKLF